MSGILRLESLTKGNTLRQGDLTLLKYRLFDADGDKLDISGKPATVRLMKNDFTFIAYEKEGLTVAPDDTISFNVNKILPGGLYHLEIIVDDKYIFPSRADEGKFNVDKSSLGAEITIIENAGIDAVVRKAVDLINDDPSLIIDEDKLISEIIANTSVGSIEEYYQEYRDAIKEYADLKPKAVSAVSKSEEALTKSQNALNVANGIDAKATNALSLSESADTLSKSVQEQFNQVVIDGDSSVEAAQARVDASGQTNATLKARLDKEHNEVTAQLSEIAYSMSEIKGDGITDDSFAFQQILNIAENNKVKKITFPKSNYKIHQPLFIKGDDIEIDFSGSTIISTANATNGIAGELGILNFHGELIGGDIMSYYRSTIDSTVPQAPPPESPQLLTYASIKEKTNPLSTFIGGRITTSNNDYFDVGDEVLIKGWTNSSSVGHYNKDIYEPELGVIAKILNKDETYIYIDYYSPFIYPSFVQRDKVKSVVMKVSTKKNIKIKNLNISDISPIETLDGIPTPNDRKQALCPINVMLCDNFELENINVVGHRGNAIHPLYSRNIAMRNIKANNARIWDGGMGYGTQIISCRDIEIDTFTGDGCRHVVDFSWSCYANVKNIRSHNSKSSDIDLHGLCEHDITFERCEGYVAMGNGMPGFPNIVKNIQFIDCNIEMPSLIGHAVVDDRFIDNVLIRGGKLKIRHIPPFLNFTIDDVDIDWEVNAFANETVNKRSQKINVIHSIKNSRVHLTNNGTVYDLYLANPDKTLIDNVIFSFANDYAFTSIGARMTTQDGSLEIRNSDLDRIGIRYNTTMPSSYLVLDNNRAKYINEGYFVTFNRIVNCLLKIKIKGNIIEHLGSAVQFFALNGESANMSNSQIKGTFEGNTFIGNPNAKVHYVHRGVNAPEKATIYIHDSDNVIEFKDTAGSVMFDSVRNLIIP